MIEKIKHVDENTVSAVGPRFDLDKVLGTTVGIIRTLSRRADMRFGDKDDPTFAFSEDDRSRPFDDEGLDLIAMVFRQCREHKYDVTMFSCEVRFGPFLADLFPLGFDILRGPVGNCLTDRDLDWKDLDPTPVMFVMMSRGMIDPIAGAHHDFLTKTLDSFLPQGILWEPYDDTGEELAFCVRFPHETFGAGRGPIRICRVQHRVHPDAEHEEEE